MLISRFKAIKREVSGIVRVLLFFMPELTTKTLKQNNKLFVQNADLISIL